MAISRIAGVAVAISFCAGCAGTQERTTYVPPRATSTGTIQADSVYMQRVEQQALMRGIDVTWVNPPTRRVKPGTPR